MAAITLSEGQRFDSLGVFKHVEKFLPTYARPRFIRIQVCSILAVSAFVLGALFTPRPVIIHRTVIGCRAPWTSQARSSI